MASSTISLVLHSPPPVPIPPPFPLFPSFPPSVRAVFVWVGARPADRLGLIQRPGAGPVRARAGPWLVQHLDSASPICTYLPAYLPSSQEPAGAGSRVTAETPVRHKRAKRLLTPVQVTVAHLLIPAIVTRNGKSGSSAPTLAWTSNPSEFNLPVNWTCQWLCGIRVQWSKHGQTPPSPLTVAAAKRVLLPLPVADLSHNSGSGLPAPLYAVEVTVFSSFDSSRESETNQLQMPQCHWPPPGWTFCRGTSAQPFSSWRAGLKCPCSTVTVWLAVCRCLPRSCALHCKLQLELELPGLPTRRKMCFSRVLLPWKEQKSR